MIINMVLILFFLIGMIIMLVTIDDEYKWFNLFLLVPIISLMVFFELDSRHLAAQQEIEKKKKQLLQEELNEKQKKERIENDKNTARELLEQSGMKFFLKYYDILIRLPVRDIEVNENYPAEEKSERLTAAKSIIEKGLTRYAAQYIADNYSDMITDEEKTSINKILSEK